MSGDETRQRGRRRAGQGRAQLESHDHRPAGERAGDQDHPGGGGGGAAHPAAPRGAEAGGEKWLLHQLQPGESFDWEEFGGGVDAKLSTECKESLEALMRAAPKVSQCRPPQRFRALLALLPEPVIFGLIDCGSALPARAAADNEHPLLPAFVVYLQLSHTCVFGPTTDLEQVEAVVTQEKAVQYLLHCLCVEILRRRQAFEGVVLPRNPFAEDPREWAVAAGMPVEVLVETIEHPLVKAVGTRMMFSWQVMMAREQGGENGPDLRGGPASGSAAVN
jgi:hypothetical protein